LSEMQAKRDTSTALDKVLDKKISQSDAG
jgi:hypothetical protein